MSITPYGNAQPGDYPAIFTGCFEARYPRTTRLIFGFAILNADRRTPHDGRNGEGLYAVAVCNQSAGRSPKSKAFWIRKAMLQPEEYQDLMLATSPPAAEHFEQPFNDCPRVLDIRVARRETDARPLSLVTHICRPRDRVWQLIEGVYEGAQPGTRNGRPFWLNEDGTTIPYDDAHAMRAYQAGQLPQGEATEWTLWNRTTRDHYERWLNPDGTLRELAGAELEALGADASVRYRIAQRRSALGLLAKPVGEAELLEVDGDPINAFVEELFNAE